MSMNHWPAGGHVLEVNDRNIDKLCTGKGILDELGGELLAWIEDEGADSVRNSEIGDKFEQQIQERYGVQGEFIFIYEEADGLDGVEPNVLYLVFNDEQKYVKTVRPQWEALPVDPHEASWADFG